MPPFLTAIFQGHVVPWLSRPVVWAALPRRRPPSLSQSAFGLPAEIDGLAVPCTDPVPFNPPPPLTAGQVIRSA